MHIWILLTWVVCKFCFPDRMLWSVGYLIPNSQGKDSFRRKLPTTQWFAGPSSAAASAASVSKVCRYCKCPARVCHLRMHAKTSLLFVHCANRLQKSMWQCSGPCPNSLFNLQNSLKHEIQQLIHICIQIWIRSWMIQPWIQVWISTEYLGAEVLWPSKEKNFASFVQYAMSLFKVPTWLFSCLLGRLDFKSSNSSTEFCWSFAKSDATSPKRRWRIFHLRAERCTSMISSLGSSIGLSPRKGDPTGAEAIWWFTYFTCEFRYEYMYECIEKKYYKHALPRVQWGRGEERAASAARLGCGRQSSAFQCVCPHTCLRCLWNEQHTLGLLEALTSPSPANSIDPEGASKHLAASDQTPVASLVTSRAPGHGALGWTGTLMKEGCTRHILRWETGAVPLGDSLQAHPSPLQDRMHFVVAVYAWSFAPWLEPGNAFCNQK